MLISNITYLKTFVMRVWKFFLFFTNSKTLNKKTRRSPVQILLYIHIRRMTHYITAESVTPWHPDKLCDRISDAVLDACFAQDPHARVACECYATTWVVIVWGEITTTANINIEDIARKEIIAIWYNNSDACFDGNTCAILNLVHRQSPDIAVWVDTGWAWDQWIMFWYATDETPAYMPLPIWYAHRLAEKLYTVRQQWVLPYLLPDGKTQVTVKYNDDGSIAIDTVVLSTQHTPAIDQKTLHTDIIREVIAPVLWEYMHDGITFHINPTGIFTIGGPTGDCGLTGRKIIIDTYGGIWRHGWWAFSGKDPTKVDRSGAYIARYLAKNIVASGIANTCEIQISYAIGVAQPISIYVDCFGTEKVSIDTITKTIHNSFDLSPAGIIKHLKLREQKYLPTTSFGHFGREEFSWEKLDNTNIFASLLTGAK